MGVNRIPVYILAGGRSARFGSDKARAVFGGRPLIQHVAHMLGSVASSITVVADRWGKYTDLGLRTISDINPGCGPLAGLQTALQDLPKGWFRLLLCPCDAVEIRPAWLGRLLAVVNTDCDAVAFRADYWQPMPALYVRSSLPTIAEQLQTDDRSMQRLLDRLRAIALPLPEDWPEDWQVNTPDDLGWRRNRP